MINFLLLVTFFLATFIRTITPDVATPSANPKEA